MKIDIRTSASFVNLKGETVSFQDYFAGALKYVEIQHGRGAISESQAKDIFQEAAAKILTSAPRHAGENVYPKTYGYRVAQCCHIDSWRSEKDTDPLSSHMLVDKEGELYLPSSIGGRCVEKRTPESDCLSKEELRIVKDFTAKLKPVDKKVVEMTAIGYKPKEIAKTLGITPNAVALRHFKLKKALAERFRECGYVRSRKSA